MILNDFYENNKSLFNELESLVIICFLSVGLKCLSSLGTCVHFQTRTSGLLTGQVWAGRVLKSFWLRCPILYMARLAEYSEMLSLNCLDPTFLYPGPLRPIPSLAPAGDAVSLS